MKGRAGRNGGASTDLLVCFPSRGPLTLMPKQPTRSPSRAADARKRRPGTRAPVSPLFKTKSRSSGAEIAEPTSPKVTCAGQVKARNCKPPRSGEPSSRSWLSVVEEIEKLRLPKKRRPHWLGAPCLKRDVMHFAAALRGLGLACLCSFQDPARGTSDGEDSDEDEESEEAAAAEAISTVSKTTSSRCLLQLLQENRGVAGNCDDVGRNERKRDERQPIAPPPSLPPPNALLLMRCRSAPAKGETVSKMTREHQGEEEEEEKLLPATRNYADLPEKENWVVERSYQFTRSRSWRR